MDEYEQLPEEVREAIQDAARIAFSAFGAEHVTYNEATGYVELSPWVQGKVVYTTAELRKLSIILMGVVEAFKTAVQEDVLDLPPRLVEFINVLDVFMAENIEEGNSTSTYVPNFNPDELN